MLSKIKIYLAIVVFVFLASDAVAQVTKKVDIVIKDTAIAGSVDYSLDEIKYKDYIIDRFDIRDSANFHSTVKFGGAKFLRCVTLSNSKFFDTVDFTNVEFKNCLAFFDVKFKKVANFAYSKFSIQTIFENDTFANLTNFDEAESTGTLEFQQIKFLEQVNFSSAKFSGYTFFINSIFSKDADFRDSQFSELDFGFVQFLGNADFERSSFSSHVSFENILFSKGLNLSRAKISNTIDFSNSKFKHNSILNLNHLYLKDNSYLSFKDAILPDTILFSENNNFQSNIDFSEANFNNAKPINLYLYNSNIAKLHLDYFHFRLLLPDSSKSYKCIGEKMLSYDEKAAIYEALLNNFKTNGQTDSYKLLDIEYQHFKWLNSWTFWLPCFSKYWWNFGYDKEYVFGWTFGFLLAFTFFTYFFLYSLNTKVYPIKKIPVNESWCKSLSFDDFGDRLWYSLMYTSTVFFLLTLKIENIHFKEKKGTFYLFTVYTVGLICLAYMANFVLQK